MLKPIGFNEGLMNSSSQSLGGNDDTQKAAKDGKIAEALGL